jgi:hypothetical protein
MTPAGPQLTETQLRELMTAFSDHRQFCRESLSIRNQVGSKVGLELSPGQVKLAEAVRSQRARGKPVRLVVLKTRRSFFTAGAASVIFHEVPFFAGRRATIIANQYHPAALEAFDYMAQYQLSYRPFERHGSLVRLPTLIKPQNLTTPVSKGATLEMTWSNGASIDVLSAEGGDVGRGGGRHWLLCDELAFWRAAGLTLTSVLNTIPKASETGVIAMSTANGLGGEFYDLVQLARDPANISGWEFLFFGWLEHPPYRAPVEDPARFQASLDVEEKLLVSMHSATLEQLSWRRLTIATECRGSIDLFHQEYPTTPEEAFLASGRPRFNHQDLARHPVCDGTAGELQLIEQPPTKRLIFIPRDHGALSIWKKPEPGHNYVLSADPSEGKDVSSGKRGDNPDYSVGFVTDRWSGEQVALLRERIRPAEFADQLAYLGRWYNYAFLIPEANNAGFIDALVRTGYPLELIYTRQRDPTDRRPAAIQEIGFQTTALTRQWIISAAEEAIRTLAITIRSPIVLRECQTFVIKPNGKAEHRDDCHDDCVIALGLNVIGNRVAPKKPFDAGGLARPARIVQVGSALRKKQDDD